MKVCLFTSPKSTAYSHLFAICIFKDKEMVYYLNLIELSSSSFFNLFSLECKSCRQTKTQR